MDAQQYDLIEIEVLRMTDLSLFTVTVDRYTNPSNYDINSEHMLTAG